MWIERSGRYARLFHKKECLLGAIMVTILLHGGVGQRPWHKDWLLTRRLMGPDELHASYEKCDTVARRRLVSAVGLPPVVRT